MVVHPGGQLTNGERPLGAQPHAGPAGSAERAVATLLERLHGETRGLELVQIQANGSALGDELADNAITTLDLDAAAEAIRDGAASQGGGLLGFQPGAFDYAVAVDVLEHMEPSLRFRLLSELRRVSRRGVVIVGPFDSEWVRGIDRIVGDAMPANGERPAPPPELPRLDETRRFFEAHGDQTAVYADQSLPLWAATRCLSLAGSDLNGELRKLDDGLYVRSSNGDLASYRSLLVCLREASSLNGAALGAARVGESRQLDGGSVAAMLATVALSNELRELHRRLEAEEDRVRSARATLARRDAQIEDLSRRLADSLTSLSVERGERELSERDMAAMKKSRLWRLMARMYFVTGRLQSAVKAPVRLVRDLWQRGSRRIRAG
jgi:hypothetical protein